MSEEYHDLAHPDGSSFDIHVDAGYTDPDDPDVQHSLTWWFSPVLNSGPEDARFEVSKFVHKEWTEACNPASFTEKHEGEKLVESAGWPAEDIGMDDVPDVIIECLMEMLGVETVRRSVEHDGGTLPENLYECLGCDGVYEGIPRRTCPDCGEDSLVQRLSYSAIGSDRELLERLANAEVKVSTERPYEDE